MDEAFSVFIEEVGQPMHRQEVPTSAIERYKGKLPDRLLQYWSEHGWCGYGDGMFWTVNPQDYESVVASMLNSAGLEAYDRFHLIARGAFGDLYLFGEKTGFSLKIVPHVGRYIGRKYELTTTDMNRRVQNFFASRCLDSNDFGDMFEPAKNNLGILGPDEMYGFVPALVFGGPTRLENLEKLKAIEHLVLLSQLCAFEPYSFSDF
ncbi:GAD-like domain-containing protein [Pseudomonas sp. NPDC089428]|uniref:GAD-like domain-containing protein n=1 Tax=Pseudomonas sp. NPDC089428 TaxID=3364467 RepID=UPI00382080BD